MTQHHRQDVAPYAPAETVNQTVYRAIFPKGLTRTSALILIAVRAGRDIEAFFYDARNGRASWL